MLKREMTCLRRLGAVIVYRGRRQSSDRLTGRKAIAQKIVTGQKHHKTAALAVAANNSICALPRLAPRSMATRGGLVCRAGGDSDCRMRLRRGRDMKVNHLEMPETPEQKARRAIDANLAAAGWLVQERDTLDLTAGRAIAVCEFPLRPGFGFADYLLYLDRKAIGAVEAKAEGTLTGVEAQSAKYAAGLPDILPTHNRPLPFLFESNGAVIRCTNSLDPIPRSRPVFNFPSIDPRRYRIWWHDRTSSVTVCS